MRGVRFARALALSVSFGAGCSARTVDQATGPTGSCVDRSASKLLGCAQGYYCSHSGTELTCSPILDAGNPALTTCGILSCDSNHCSCSTTSSNTCECTGAVIGPLPPPDLAA